MAKLEVTTEELPLTPKRHWKNAENPLREIDFVYLKPHRRIDERMINYSV